MCSCVYLVVREWVTFVKCVCVYLVFHTEGYVGKMCKCVYFFVYVLFMFFTQEKVTSVKCVLVCIFRFSHKSLTRKVVL